MIEDKEATIKVMEALRDASDIRFSKMEEHMSRMEHDVSAQRVENKQLDNACRHMADELWIISRNYSVQQDRVKKLEEAMIIANEHLLESQTSHIGSDAKVTVLQVRIQDLELKWEWINKQGEDYNVTMGLIQERLDMMEESVDSLVKGVARCDSHWGQGPVYRAGTSQVHHKEMDKVPSMYPPGTSQVHPEFSLPIFLQFPWPGEWPVHSQCPRSCDCDVPIR